MGGERVERVGERLKELFFEGGGGNERLWDVSSEVKQDGLAVGSWTFVGS